MKKTILCAVCYLSLFALFGLGATVTVVNGTDHLIYIGVSDYNGGSMGNKYIAPRGSAVFYGNVLGGANTLGIAVFDETLNTDGDWSFTPYLTGSAANELDYSVGYLAPSDIPTISTLCAAKPIIQTWALLLCFALGSAFAFVVLKPLEVL